MTNLAADTTCAQPGASPEESEQALLVIEPAGSWPRLDFGELWQYRGLAYFLVWRDIKLRYAQTILGLGWAVLQPLTAMAIFALVFGRFANIPSGNAPYAVFCLAALVPWTYFSSTLTTSSTSLINNANLITKIYFPRLVIPAAPVIAGLLDMAVAGVVLAGMLAWYRIVPDPAALIMVPLLVIMLGAVSFGAGAWLAALNIQYRDVKHATPFLLQIWFYASPIVYPASMVPEDARGWYALNPVAGIIESFRAVLLGTVPIPWAMLRVSLASTVVLLVTGVWYFRRTERIFADVA